MTGRLTVDTPGDWAINSQSNNWSMVTADGSGNLNSAATSSAGSIHVNDIYVRSVSKWVSQINWAGVAGPQGATGATGSTGATGAQGPQGPQGSSVAGLVYINFSIWGCTSGGTAIGQFYDGITGNNVVLCVK